MVLVRRSSARLEAHADRRGAGCRSLERQCAVLTRTWFPCFLGAAQVAGMDASVQGQSDLNYQHEEARRGPRSKGLSAFLDIFPF